MTERSGRGVFGAGGQEAGTRGPGDITASRIGARGPDRSPPSFSSWVPPFCALLSSLRTARLPPSGVPGWGAALAARQEIGTARRQPVSVTRTRRAHGSRPRGCGPWQRPRIDSSKPRPRTSASTRRDAASCSRRSCGSGEKAQR